MMKYSHEPKKPRYMTPKGATSPRGTLKEAMTRFLIIFTLIIFCPLSYSETHEEVITLEEVKEPGAAGCGCQRVLEEEREQHEPVLKSEPHGLSPMQESID